MNSGHDFAAPGSCATANEAQLELAARTPKMFSRLQQAEVILSLLERTDAKNCLRSVSLAIQCLLIRFNREGPSLNACLRHILNPILPPKLEQIRARLLRNANYVIECSERFNISAKSTRRGR